MSYHDLHVTTALIPRTRISNLPYGYEVSCTRVSGWQLWRHAIDGPPGSAQQIAGEYSTADQWLVLDVAGHIIIDSRRDDPEEEP